jgi:MFS family permease
MFASGAVIGLAVGGIIIENYGWRTTFFTIIPVAVALLLVIRRFIFVNDGDNSFYQHQDQEHPNMEWNDDSKTNSGAGIGPALAGMYVQTHQSLLIIHGIPEYFRRYQNRWRLLL